MVVDTLPAAHMVVVLHQVCLVAVEHSRHTGWADWGLAPGWIPTHVRIHISSMKEETSTHKSIKCVEVSSNRPPLRESLPGLHACNTLVRIFLSVIANDGQLEVFALEAVDH